MTTKQELDDAWGQGKKDFNWGKSRKSNPFPRGSMEIVRWWTGWDEAAYDLGIKHQPQGLPGGV